MGWSTLSNTSKLRSALRPIPSVEPRSPSFVSVARISQQGLLDGPLEGGSHLKRLAVSDLEWRLL